jgi:hypothetical protein
MSDLYENDPSEWLGEDDNAQPDEPMNYGYKSSQAHLNLTASKPS